MTTEKDDQITSFEAHTTEPLATPEEPRKRRGFASMAPELVRELAKRGGIAAHRAGTAHQFTSDEARVAGRKGGITTHEKRRAKTGNTVPS
jgi:general stress protein YciG